MKKLFSALLIIALCFLITSCTATEYYSYNYITGNLTINRIDKTDENFDTLFWSFKNPKTINIGPEVTKIPGFMFAHQHDGMSGEPRNHYDATKKVYISEGVKIIGESAFDSNGMHTISIPDSVTKIGDNAFSLCKNLKSVSFPENIKKIPYGVCQDCKNLESVTFSEGVEVIGQYAFQNCDNLTEITFPYTLKKIDDYAFYSCKKLNTVTFLNKNTKIDESLGITDGVNYSRAYNFTVKGYKGSTAEKFAQKYDYEFIPLE